MGCDSGSLLVFKRLVELLWLAATDKVKNLIRLALLSRHLLVSRLGMRDVLRVGPAVDKSVSDAMLDLNASRLYYSKEFLSALNSTRCSRYINIQV